MGAMIVAVPLLAGDPSTFSSAGSLTTGRENHSATLLRNGKVLVAGGIIFDPTPRELSSAEIYNPQTNSWSDAATMNSTHNGDTSALLPSGEVLIAGNDPTGRLCELYDPATDHWTRTGDLVNARGTHSLTPLPNGKVLAAGGVSVDGTHAPLTSAELYDPTTGVWTPTGSLLAGRYHHTATLLNDGTVLVVGGANANGDELATAERYDPASGTWSSAGNLTNQREGHTATLLPSGEVLIAGGRIHRLFIVLQTAEIFDPATGAWNPTNNMNVRRDLHTATKLRDGQVLVAGGEGNSSAELYDEASTRWTPTGSLMIGRFYHTATSLATGDVVMAGGVHVNTFPTAAELYNGPRLGGPSLNISTRARVAGGDSVLIGGLIVKGSVPKKVLVRGIGPSISQSDGTPLPGTLPDPTLELHASDTSLIGGNDNWKDSQQQEIEQTGLAPLDNRESALIATLQPGAYTAVLRGKFDASGIAVVEAYDLQPSVSSELANISSRGLVAAGDNVMIGGMILGPSTSGSARVVMRALGPSLAADSVANPLPNPTLDLRDKDGTRLAFNDDYADDPAQAEQLGAFGLTPTDTRESAIFTTLSSGTYTAIVAGKNGVAGIALLEIYNLR